MPADVSDVHAACIISALIALMMEAARTSKTSVDVQLRTRQYIPGDSELKIPSASSNELIEFCNRHKIV
jgi:hypothetical protein